MRDVLADRAPHSVLDAGCGTGRVLAALPAGWERTGLDVVPGVLAHAREHPGLHVVEGSVSDMPFEDASFDAVISLDVLSDARVADPERALAEIRRVLRPGGTLVLNLPAYQWLLSGHDRVAQTGRRYSARRVAALLRAGGFVPDRVSYRVTALFPVVALRRLLSRRGGASDVTPVAPFVNRALTALLRAENRLVRRVPLPFGLSVFAVARAEAAR